MTTTRRPRLQGGYLAAVVAAAVVALVLPGGPASSQVTTVVSGVNGTAFALQNTGSLAPIPAVSAITAPPCPQAAGTPTVVSVGSLISAGLLQTAAQCGLLNTPDGFIRMTADVANATVGNPTPAVLLPLLEVGAVHVECSADVNGVRGFTSVATISVNGVPLANVGRFDTTLDLSGVVGLLIPGATLRINERVVTADTITINGVHLTLPPLLVGSLDVIIGQVRCARELGQIEVTTTTTTVPEGTTTTTLPPGTTTTLPPGTTTTLPPGTTTTLPPGTTTTLPPGIVTVPTITIVPITITVPPSILVRTGTNAMNLAALALVALVLGTLFRRGTEGLEPAGGPPPPAEYRPVGFRPSALRRRAAGNRLDAAAADALADLESRPGEEG